MLTSAEQAKIAQYMGVSRSFYSYGLPVFGDLRDAMSRVIDADDLDLIRASLLRISDLEQKIIDNDQNLIVASVENGEAVLTPVKVVVMHERSIEKELKKIESILGYRRFENDAWY